MSKTTSSFVSKKRYISAASVLAFACISNDVQDAVSQYAPESVSTTLHKWRFDAGNTPLTQWYSPVSLCVGYLVSVYVLQTLMKNRKPFDLYWTRVIHNFVLSFGSLVMLLGMVKEISGLYMKHGIDVVICDAGNQQVNGSNLYFWLYVFYLSKFYEFIDTYVLILRKKPLIFLHVFHHFITAILAWVGLVSESPVQWIVTSLNATVHVFMYYYYLAQTVGQDMWWKKYLTTSQIIQFVIDIIGISLWFYYTIVVGAKCHGDGKSLFFTYCVLGSFLGLFIHFYLQTFKKGNSIKNR